MKINRAAAHRALDRMMDRRIAKDASTCQYCGMPVSPGKLCGRTQCVERRAREKAKDAHPDVDAIVAAFKKGGRPAAHVEFDRIARTKKLKDYEALMLAEGFKRELKAQGIEP